ncbi:ABC transporter permease [Phormidium sp. FACHB-1136]|uniref:ABC transporter permease n=1 Tax=Phormidium sp. FACHB-1136 TaxID=2692848 RepID=UPI0016891D06|nr:ABC transporter permease [Phormidium sp. FACHB-1136]MBD2424714.1 ABC transporter permease [Phormidium sp. FACHB-1136]
MNITQLLRPKQDFLALPLAIFLQLFYIVPLVILIASSFQAGADGGISLDNYLKFFGNAVNVKALTDTFWLGIQVTIACLIIGYPVAYFYVNAHARWKGVLTFLIMLPLLTSAVVRTFGWVVILGRQGLINTALMKLGLIEEPIRLLFTHNGVLIALTQIWLPMMVLPIVASLSQIDSRLAAASKSLGGGAWRTFWQITFPLTLPGMISGALLVFALTVSSFVTPSIIGGGQLIYLPTLIYQQGIVLLNQPFAAAVSTLLLIMVVAVVLLLGAFGKRSRRYIR